MHHEGVDKPLHDGALGLPEPLGGVPEKEKISIVKLQTKDIDRSYSCVKVDGRDGALKAPNLEIQRLWFNLAHWFERYRHGNGEIPKKRVAC